MRLVILWLHVLGVVVWLGGLMYQAHVLAPSARRGDPRAFSESARRARPVAWAALVIVVLTGFYNVTQLGPLERVMQTGAGLTLIGKFILVLVAVALSGQRDFAVVPRLARALAGGEDARGPLAAIMWLDRLVLVLGVVIVYLGLAVSRA
ncbi:MAG: CopD family protein [Candidatus Rokubacteria bacterium]|nr:CopD family protein [Candidatus Rokubacteria bacterium]